MVSEAGLVCQQCGNQNRPGALVCDQCGKGLVALRTETKQMGATEALHQKANDWGTARFGKAANLALDISGFSPPLLIPLLEGIVVTLGRKSDESKPPTIDLSRYKAEETLVSRQHASLTRSDKIVFLTDLGSTNGTYVNGARLVANTPVALREGDQIRLALMGMKVFFK